MRSSLALIPFALAACGGADGDLADQNGTYQITRTITEWEPSPAFDVPDTATMTITSTGVTIMPGDLVYELVRTGTQITFRASETWHSPEGDGAASMSYDLDVPGDGTISGTIAAHVIFDQPPPTGFHDFDYAFSVSGSK